MARIEDNEGNRYDIKKEKGNFHLKGDDGEYKYIGYNYSLLEQKPEHILKEQQDKSSISWIVGKLNSQETNGSKKKCLKNWLDKHYKIAEEIEISDVNEVILKTNESVVTKYGNIFLITGIESDCISATLLRKGDGDAESFLQPGDNIDLIKENIDREETKKLQEELWESHNNSEDILDEEPKKSTRMSLEQANSDYARDIDVPSINDSIEGNEMK